MTEDQVQACRRSRLQALVGHADFEGSKARLGLALNYKSGSHVSQMLKGHRPITEKTVIQIEAMRGGKYAGWFSDCAATRPAEVPRVAGARAEAHGMNLYAITVKPVELTWRDLVIATDLPALFEVHMPDGALQPNIAPGTLLLFRTDFTAEDLRPRVGILVKDAQGGRYIRRYAEAPGGRWIAQALDAAYASLDGADVSILAVMRGRIDPTV